MMIPHSFEVWVCAPPPHPCAADSDPVCFTYSEIDGVFVPWGFKSTLQFEFATDHYVASNRNANFQIAEHLDVLDKKKQKKKSRKTAKGRANRRNIVPDQYVAWNHNANLQIIEESVPKTIEEKLAEVKKLFESGLIDEVEFKELKKAILTKLL